MRIFECSDIAVVDESLERKSRNYRHLGALYSDKKGGFEVVHGLLDRIMQILDVPHIGAPGGPKFEDATHGYYIKESDDPTYFPGRAATIHFRTQATETVSPTTELGSASASGPLDTVASALKSVLPSQDDKSTAPRDIQIGTLGILHPSVLEAFSIVNPCSSLEINVEPFL